MSELYPVIKDIISLLNTKYSTEISTEQFSVTAYTPEKDDTKKEFTEADRKWLLQQVKSHSFSGGVKGLVKRMGDKFNNDLIQTIHDASRKFGDLEGVVKFLGDYENLKKQLPKGKSPAHSPPAQRIDLADPINKVKGYLARVKKNHPKDYDASFYHYTEKVLDKIMTYQRTGERIPRLEREILSLFAGEGEKNPGLIKGWRRLNIKGISDTVKTIFETLSPYTEKLEQSEDEIINPPKESPLNNLEKEIRHLADKPKLVEETDMVINKDMKGERQDEVKEIVKDVGGEEKYKHSLTIVKDYLKKAKSSYPQDFDQYSLHKYTDDLINTMESYHKGEGRDSDINKKISSIFNETPGILDMWDEIHKPISKRLRELKGSFMSLVKPTKDSKGSVDNKISSKLDELHGRANLKVTDKDKTIAKGILGKKEREYPDSGVDIDPTFFNKLIKELIKHKDDLPKKPEAKDLADLNLTKEELELAKTKEYMDLAGKALRMVDQIIADDEKITDADIATQVIKKFKDEFANTKEKDEQDKKVVIDRDIKKEQEDAKNRAEPKEKNKKSSINIIANYKGSLFYRLERLASMATDRLIKAELEDISQDIKQIL